MAGHKVLSNEMMLGSVKFIGEEATMLCVTMNLNSLFLKVGHNLAISGGLGGRMNEYWVSLCVL